MSMINMYRITLLIFIAKISVLNSSDEHQNISTRKRIYLSQTQNYSTTKIMNDTNNIYKNVNNLTKSKDKRNFEEDSFEMKYIYSTTFKYQDSVVENPYINDDMEKLSYLKFNARSSKSQVYKQCKNLLPFYVSLQALNPQQNKYQHVCGGTLLNSYWILTTAECCKSDFNIVVAGKTMLNTHSSNNQVRTIQKKLIHPDFFYPYNDVCIIKVVSPINNSSTVKYARLDSYAEYMYCDYVNIIGFGSYANKGRYILKDTNQLTCNTEYILDNCYENNVADYDEEMMICGSTLSSLSKKETAKCFGDSGSPIFCNDVVAGMVSYGHECKHYDGKILKVFLKISSYFDWISENVNDVIFDEYMNDY